MGDTYTSGIPRTRDQDKTFTEVGDWSKWVYNKTSCASGASWKLNTSLASTFISGSFKTMSDIVIPDFHERVQKGEIFFNPMKSYEKVVSGQCSGSMHMQASTNSCTGSSAYKQEFKYVDQAGWRAALGLLGWDSRGMFNGYGSILSNSDISSLITEVNTSARSQRGRGGGSTNLFETLAEVDQTIGLVGGLFKSMRKILKASKNYLVKPKDTKTLYLEASGVYLAARYGIVPLISDVEAVISGLRKKVGKVRQTTRARGSISNNRTFNSSWVFDQARIHATVDVNETYSVRAMSLDEYVADIAGNIGLSPKNLATVGWDLIPLSFVADWFLNIGDLLGSLVPVFSVNQLGACYVTDNTRITSLNSGEATPENIAWNIVEAPSFSYVVTERKKTRTPGLDAPGFVIKSDFRFSNIFRSLDALALTVQQLDKSAKLLR